jgi:N-(2-amino-2-carboxyethyl)-L-glutamate synthase
MKPYRELRRSLSARQSLKPQWIKEGVLSSIGNTPLVRLGRLSERLRLEVFAKLEAHNPGGSMKDRPAANIIKSAIKAGLITPDSVVIESSSGNMGIGLAQVCAYYGLKFICVVDVKVTSQNLKLLKAYGAEVDLVTEPDPETGELLQARVNRVKELLNTVEHSFWPDQYSNLNNSLAHHQTMREIVEAFNGDIDYFFCATSTCGTLRGCSEFVKQAGLRTEIIAVDALGSVIFGGPPSKRLIPGHGASVRPRLFKEHFADRYVQVSDLDCIVGCRQLLKLESILAGGSSGAIVSALQQDKLKLPENSTCVLLLADRGERYLETIYSDEWVMHHFGHIPSFEVYSCKVATY